MTPTRVVLLCALAAGPVALPADTNLSAPQALGAYDGRPEFREGSDLSYFVWREGEKWHLRWTTVAAPRQFEGMVRATHGKLEDLRRIDPEAEYRVIRPGRPPRVVRGPAGRVRGVAPGRPATVAARTEDKIEKVADHLIRWVTRTDVDIDGFDFKVKDVDELVFDLRIQGQSKAATVEIGAKNVHPPTNPFTVRLGNTNR